MNKHLYPCFKHWPGTIWFYSDPHFSDADLETYRAGITDDEQIRRINSKVGKTGTIVFLGDIGNIECIKRIKGYKVLILGNHDKGASKYQRVINEEDNRLFDEVYEGTLQIASDIILSHEPVDYPYCLNIHGHDHSGYDFMNHVLKYYDADMSPEDMLENYLDTIKTDNLTKLNICAEWINYTPVSIERIVKSGILHNIPDIHRETINAATFYKKK